MRNILHNALILREKYPPLFRCNRISYSTRIGADSTLLHTDNRCVGRVLLFLVFSLLFVPFLSGCTGDDTPSGYEPYNTHPDWTDSNPEAFWD